MTRADRRIARPCIDHPPARDHPAAGILSPVQPRCPHLPWVKLCAGDHAWKGEILMKYLTALAALVALTFTVTLPMVAQAQEKGVHVCNNASITAAWGTLLTIAFGDTKTYPSWFTREIPATPSNSVTVTVDNRLNLALVNDERLIPLTTVPQDAVPAAGPGIPGGIRAAARKVGIRVGCGCAGAPAGAVAESGRGIRSDQACPSMKSR